MKKLNLIKISINIVYSYYYIYKYINRKGQNAPKKIKV